MFPIARTTTLRPPVLTPASFDQLFDEFFAPLTRVRPGAWCRYPHLNLFERDDAYAVEVELPGLRREEIELRLDGRTLTVRGERGEVEVPDGARAHRGRWSGRFERSITLPDGFVAGEASARLENGILTVELPKNPAARARTIEIQ